MRAPVTAIIIAALAINASAATIRARFLMGTVCEITASDEKEIASAFDEAARLEAMLSTWRTDSELARVNSGRTVRASDELLQIIYDVLKYRDYTEGAFDPRVGPLVDLWETRKRGVLPDEASIRAALSRVQMPNPEFGPNNAVRMQGGARIEEGAFAKGYALDRMMSKIKGELVIINFGGQIAARGRVPVTIANPARRDNPVLGFTMGGGSLSTSSGSERTFESGGKRFSHIIDPRNGRALPPHGSASVLSSSAFVADIESTALYVMGPEEGIRWADEHGVAALFIDQHNHIRVSKLFRAQIRDLEILDSQFKLQE